jgi:hypothetical protein
MRGSQINYELEASVFVCSMNHSLSSMVCINSDCAIHPCICSDHDCACHGPHITHDQVPLEGFLQRLNKPLHVSEDIQLAEKTLDLLVDGLIDRLTKIKSNYKKQLAKIIREQYQYAGLQ